MWCYFVIAFFDWTNGVFQQTVVKVYCMLNNPAGPSGLLQVCSFIKKKPQHKRFPVKYAKNTVFIERLRWLLLKIHWKSNLWQFGLQYCRLWDFKLNENVLHQRGLDGTFKENILAKVNSLKLLKKKLPHWFFSQTLITSPWTNHALLLLKSFFNHYFFTEVSADTAQVFDVFESWI